MRSIFRIALITECFFFGIVLLGWLLYLDWEFLKSNLQWYFIFDIVIAGFIFTWFLWSRSISTDIIKEWSDFSWNILAAFGIGTFIAKTGNIADWQTGLPTSVLLVYLMLLSITASVRIAAVLTKIVSRKWICRRGGGWRHMFERIQRPATLTRTPEQMASVPPLSPASK